MNSWLLNICFLIKKNCRAAILKVSQFISSYKLNAGNINSTFNAISMLLIGDCRNNQLIESVWGRTIFFCQWKSRISNKSIEYGL